MFLRLLAPVHAESFREALHEAIESALGDGVDDIQLASATQIGEGWMHIHGTSGYLIHCGLFSQPAFFLPLLQPRLVR